MENGIFCLRLIWPVAVPGKVLPYFLCTFVSSWLCGYKSIMQNKANLPGVEINAISLFTKDYENFMLHESQKNKANRRSLAGNPKHESRNPKRVERAI